VFDADRHGVKDGGCGHLAPVAEEATSLVVSLRHRTRVVTAVLTGLLPPRTSHLAVVEAFVGFDGFARSYTATLQEGYRWGEWGDRQLLFRPPVPLAEHTEEEAR
jgi:S-adenosylmethionine:tRNA-ribosyltransferase-isomerase (queuine synthetase)